MRAPAPVLGPPQERRALRKTHGNTGCVCRHCAIRKRQGTSASWRASSPARRRTHSASRPHAGSSPRRSISWTSGRRAFLCFRVRSKTARRSSACTASIAMRATRAPSAAARSGISVLRVPRCPRASAKQAVSIVAATRSTSRPRCGSHLCARHEARPSFASGPRADAICGLVKDLVQPISTFCPNKANAVKFR